MLNMTWTLDKTVDPPINYCGDNLILDDIQWMNVLTKVSKYTEMCLRSMNTVAVCSWLPL